VLVLGALLGQLLAGCGGSEAAETAAMADAERDVTALPDVVGADFHFDAGGIDSGPYLTAYLVAPPTAPAERVAQLMAAAVDRVYAAGVPALTGRVQLSLGDVPHHLGDPRPGATLTLNLRSQAAGDAVAAETRYWLALRQALPGAHVSIEPPYQGPGLRRSVGISTPGADLPAELTRVFTAYGQVEPPPAVESTLAFAVAPPEGEYHSAVVFTSRLHVPPPEVLATMRAMAELGPSQRPNSHGLIAAWTYDDTNAQPYLDVELDIGLDEFYRTPGNRIDDLIPGSETERIALAHQAVLDAAGIPYRLRAAAYAHEPFLDVDRR
jgi:hypothetical protein